MSPAPQSTPAAEASLRSLRERILLPASRHWGLLLAWGILALVFGSIGFFQPLAYSVGVAIFFGAMLLVTGGSGLVMAWRIDGWKGKTSAIVMALFSLLAGGLMVFNPVLAAESLTLVVAAYLVAMGLTKAWLGVTHREAKGWGLIVLSGAISLALGLILFAGWPGSGLWALGLFLSIELIFDGWAAVVFAFEAHRMAKQTDRAVV
ncbi:MAG: HdeD family acid-resistance protein [Burkholderiaceae bacterium]